MQNFDLIEKLWNSHSVEVKISSDEMLKQAKKEVFLLKRKSLLTIIGMSISFILVAAWWYTYPFSSISTHIGIAITLLAVLGATIVLFKDYRLLSKNDITVHPQAFLEKLKVFQLNRIQFYNKLYWIYIVALSIGISFYYVEIFQHLSIVARWVILISTAFWMIYCSTIVRRIVIKKEKERIGLLIEKFERLISQLR